MEYTFLRVFQLFPKLEHFKVIRIVCRCKSKSCFGLDIYSLQTLVTLTLSRQFKIPKKQIDIENSLFNVNILNMLKKFSYRWVVKDLK